MELRHTVLCIFICMDTVISYLMVVFREFLLTVMRICALDPCFSVVAFWETLKMVFILVQFTESNVSFNLMMVWRTCLLGIMKICAMLAPMPPLVCIAIAK